MWMVSKVMPKNKLNGADEISQFVTKFYGVCVCVLREYQFSLLTFRKITQLITSFPFV